MSTYQDKAHIRELAAKIEALYLENLLQDDLTISEMIALHIISSLSNPTIVEFANAIKISQSNATYIIHKLVRKGYVTKVPSSSDGRVFLLNVTEDYANKLHFYDNYLAEVLEMVLSEAQEDDLMVMDRINVELIRELSNK